MKIYISADIEGVTGIAHWDETHKAHSDYPVFRDQMMKEVKAACEGVLLAGAKEIWIKDAHGSGRNLDPAGLPSEVKLVRSWSGHPFCMMQEITESFAAVIMIGYHAYSGSGGNPLAHTMDTQNISSIKINGRIASEFLINAYTASYVGVPVIFLSGDEEVCNHAKSFNSFIKTLAVNQGLGNSVISIHPGQAVTGIRESVAGAMAGDFRKCLVELPGHFEVEISFIKHFKAYRASFYPGMRQISPTNVVYETKNYFDVLRMMLFVLEL